MRERLACFVSARNLGDAAIQGTFIRLLVERGYAEEYIVWTRAEAVPLFENIAGCTIVESSFPVGRYKRVDAPFFAALRKIRSMSPSVSIDFIGDFRERVLGFLTGSEKHVAIAWEREHPFRELIWAPAWVNGQYVVPRSVSNVYDAYRCFSEALLGRELPSGAPSGGRTLIGAGSKVGFHPFASQACRTWPLENWRELANRFVTRGATVSVFCSPSERESVESVFGSDGRSIRILSGTVAYFLEQVTEMDLFIGLDSFGVHAAHLRGVRSVMLNGANMPGLWTPPSAKMIAHSGGCRYFPCFNRPKCIGSDREFACIRSVSVDDVLAVVEQGC